jgi:molybdenum cofactor biosynthesis enzyme MoaA
MDLDKIGFYTLSNERAKGVATSVSPPLSRCEILLTSRCNFKCPYCRHVGGKDLPFEEVKRVLDLWITRRLNAVRFSGGEPTIWPGIVEAITYCKGKIPKIAISSNGSAPWSLYEKLIDAGANDFSISLDACCAADGQKMAGIPFNSMFNTITSNIKRLSQEVYTTVGIVLTQDNIEKAHNIIQFANDLGVSDIRVIPAAQFSPTLKLPVLPDSLLNKHPILKWRWERMQQQEQVRGIPPSSCNKCPLVLDDMAVMEGKHYPCIIYLREGGEPIGDVGETMTDDRRAWFTKHDSCKNPICSQNCLDFCQAHNYTVSSMMDNTTAKGGPT